MYTALILFPTFLILASSHAQAGWIDYPIKGKFIQYSYEVLSRSGKGRFIKIKLLSEYPKPKDIEIKNQSISYQSRVDFAMVDCADRTKEIQITSFELYENANGEGWNYKSVPKKIKWEKVQRKSTLDSLLGELCSSD